MANIVKIDITNKYKADRDVLWYSDETGLRFSRSQLIEFILRQLMIRIIEET